LTFSGQGLDRRQRGIAVVIASIGWASGGRWAAQVQQAGRHRTRVLAPLSRKRIKSRRSTRALLLCCATTQRLACRCQHSFGTASDFWLEWHRCCGSHATRGPASSLGQLRRLSGWQRCGTDPPERSHGSVPPPSRLARQQDSLQQEFSISTKCCRRELHAMCAPICARVSEGRRRPKT
jgi:hypothetical protein